MDLNPTPIIRKESDKRNFAKFIPKTKKVESSRYDDTASNDYDYLKPSNLPPKIKEPNIDLLDYINDNKEFNGEDNYEGFDEDIILTHMNIIKDDAKLLTDEGILISNFKGVGKETSDMEEYTSKLETIINKKLSIYQELKRKLDKYQNSKENKDREEMSPRIFI